MYLIRKLFEEYFCPLAQSQIDLLLFTISIEVRAEAK